MSLLDAVKSLLGLGDTSEAPRRQGDVSVTVEHDPTDEPAPATAVEDAVKGTATATDSVDDDGDAAASGTSSPDAHERTPSPDPDPSAADEPDPSAVDEPDPSAVDEPEPSAAGESDATDAAGSTTDEGEPLDVIKGIGPTYADRLADAGIETVDHLAGADPASLAELTDISEKRLRRWVERANHR